MASHILNTHTKSHTAFHIVALMLLCCVRLPVCNICIVAEQCTLPKTLSEEANRKWPMGYWGMTCLMRSHDPEKSRSWQPQYA